VEERRQPSGEEETIDLGVYFAVLRRQWWKIALLSLVVGVITLIVMLRVPNSYKATAVITPAGDEGIQSNVSYLSALGISKPGKAEDLETLLKSNDLTVRVFQKHDLWPIVSPDRFDPKTGKFKSGGGGLFGKPQEAKTPTDWDAIRAAKGRLVISLNKKNGTLSLSFESPSAESSAQIVRYYLDEAKSRLQEEAFERAGKNKKFIEEQIGRTVDALTRDRLYSMYGQEVEREMLARNRDQFGFRTIDSPRVPDRKSGPGRGRAAVAATLFCGFLFAIYFIARDRRKQA
jgi:uncharacterized protein involved in exopolysaccharide biosynthesis